MLSLCRNFTDTTASHMEKRNKLLEVYRWFEQQSDGAFVPPEGWTVRQWIRYYYQQVPDAPTYAESTLMERIHKWKTGQRLPSGAGRHDAHLFDDNRADPPEPTWAVEDGWYVFDKTNHGPFRIEVEAVDHMAFLYASKGADWTARSIRAEIERLYEREFPLWQWNVVKARLQLYKDGNIFSSHTWDNTPPEQREAMVAAKMRELTKHAPNLIEKKYRHELHGRYKRVIEGQTRAEFFLEAFTEALIDEVGTNPLGSRKLPYHHKRPEAPGVAVISMADLHYGLRFDDLPRTLSYSTDVLRAELLRAAQRINAIGAGEVHIAIMGDLIESATGLNKRTTALALERGQYGAKAMYGCLDLIIEFLAAIRNLRKVKGVTGNHDRFSPNKEDDPLGQLGLAMYEYLSRHTPYEIDYDSLIVHEDYGLVRMIWVHGDDRILSTKAGKDEIYARLFKHGRPGAYNQVHSAHLHHLAVPKDDLIFQHISVPSLVTSADYAHRSGWDSNPRIMATTFVEEGWPENRFIPVGAPLSEVFSNP